MMYGLHLSASGVLTNSYRQDVFANNLANAQTVGFKPDLPSLRQRNPESLEDVHPFEYSNDLLDRLSGGVLAGTQRIDFSPGPVEQTNNPHDIALDAPETFLAVQVLDPKTNETTIQLTRDGRLTRSSQGFLVMASNGKPVLDDANNPIQIPEGQPFFFNPNGDVQISDEVIATLQITGVTDVNQLIKQGGNLFAMADGIDLREQAPNATIRPEHLEASGVDPIQTLMDLVSATKAATGNGNLIRYHDSLIDRAVNVLGRVA